MTLIVTRPFIVQPYSNTTSNSAVNFTEENFIETKRLLVKSHSKLKLNYMNDEERGIICSLCYEYRIIFYGENIPLSFTNEVKHCIRTTNEEPVLIRTYRLPPTYTNA